MVEIQGRRARITSPTAGWVSFYSTEGYEICKFFKASPSKASAPAPVAASKTTAVPAPASTTTPVDFHPNVLGIDYKPGLYTVSNHLIV